MEACGEEGQLKLLGVARSPFVVRVRIALALKGIDYEFMEENLLLNKSQLLLQSNPVHKKVPVLFHNGKPVCESMIIVQYIEEAWDTKAPNLMPNDPYDRAIARFWAAFVDDKVITCLYNHLSFLSLSPLFVFSKILGVTMEACGEEGQLKLLGVARSPFVVRVRIALALKGIDYEFIEEDIQNKSQLLLQSNPVHKKIPVLLHNGNPVCESMIIVQYIEEAWKSKEPNLMPKDPYDRAIARFWAAFVEDKLVLSIAGVYNGEGEQQQKAAEESVANFLLLEEALSGKAYFGGDEIGLVDISLGGILVFIKTLEKVTNIVLIDTRKNAAIKCMGGPVF